MTSSYHSSEEPRKDTLIKSNFSPSLQSVLYNETRRIKKITTALYVVTDHIDDLENLKRHIRQYTTDLLKVSHVPYSANAEELEFRMSFILSYTDALMSFIEVAYAGQFISEGNTQLLLRELRSLSIHVHHRYQDIVGGNQGPVNLADEIDIKHILKEKESDSDTHTRTTSPQSSTESSAPKTKSSRSAEDTQPMTAQDLDAPLSSREERKEHIIAVIKKNDSAAIKDIAMHINGCSEKTLQRDIKELITDGRIIKEGSRRWSTYKIKE